MLNCLCGLKTNRKCHPTAIRELWCWSHRWFLLSVYDPASGVFRFIYAHFWHQESRDVSQTSHFKHLWLWSGPILPAGLPADDFPPAGSLAARLCSQDPSWNLWPSPNAINQSPRHNSAARPPWSVSPKWLVTSCFQSYIPPLLSCAYLKSLKQTRNDTWGVKLYINRNKFCTLSVWRIFVSLWPTPDWQVMTLEKDLGRPVIPAACCSHQAPIHHFAPYRSPCSPG